MHFTKNTWMEPLFRWYLAHSIEFRFSFQMICFETANTAFFASFENYSEVEITKFPLDREST